MKPEYVITIRPRRLALGTATVLVVLFLTGAGAYALRFPVVTWMGRQLVDVDPLSRADAILVLAGATPEREIEAADLYRAGYAPRIVLTREPEREGTEELRHRGIAVPLAIDNRRQVLRSLEVPDEAVVVVEPQIISTAEESERVAAWVRSQPLRSLLIVTSATHTARSRYIFESSLRGTGVEVRMRAAALLEYDPDSERAAARETIIEWQKLLFYRVRYCCW